MNGHPPTALPKEAPGSICSRSPCFAHAPYLPDLLDSIVAQTRPPDEVIMVDDDSPDSTNEMLRAL
jgi:GT2 family glycosyltransferase